MKDVLWNLEFKDSTGVDAKGSFATFRIGASWAYRLQKEDRVACSSKIFFLGIAKVLQVDMDDSEKILLKYAKDSHLEKYLTDAENAPARRLQSMQKLYGPHIWGTKPHRVITCIILEML